MGGVIPKLKPEDLERILLYLPKPTHTKLYLRNHSSRKDEYVELKKRIIEEYPFMKDNHIFDPEKVIFNFNRMNKEKVLAIYRIYYERKEQLEGIREGFDPSKIILEIEEIYWGISRIDQRDYKIPEGEGVDIQVRPDNITIYYTGEEPDFVTNIRKELEGKELSVKVNEPPN